MTAQRYLNSQPGAHEDELAGRRVLRDMEDGGVSALGLLDSRLEELYITIPVGDNSGWHSTCKVIRPRSSPPSTTKRPLIVMFHGGAFRRGSPEMYTRPGREFALEYDAVIVSVEYRLAPEYPWPHGVLDAYDVCAYLAEAAVSGNDAVFGHNVQIDTTRFIVAGASAGGNMACAVLSLSLLHSFKDSRNGREWSRSPLKSPIAGIYLGVPFLLDKDSVPSKYKDIYQSHSIDLNESAQYDDLLRLYNADTSSPMFSPVNLPNELLRKWPKTYAQVGDRDIVRDDGIILEKVLRDNAVQTRLDNYGSLGHTTWSVYTTGPNFTMESQLGSNSMAAMSWLLENNRVQ